MGDRASANRKQRSPLSSGGSFAQDSATLAPTLPSTGIEAVVVTLEVFEGGDRPG